MTTEQSATAPGPLATTEPWDMVAEAYTRDLSPMFELFSRDALRLAALPPGSRIVDVATGPGTLELLAAAEGHEVTALDFSAKMLAELRARAAAAALGRLEIVEGDGQSLPLESASRDGAFSMFGLMFFPDRAAGFRELRRVLRPGGRAVVASWAPFEGAFAAMMDAIQAELPDIPFKGGTLPLGTPDGFRTEMSAAGFTQVQIHTVVHSVSSSSIDALWIGAQRNSAPVVLVRKRLGEERWAAVARGVAERLRAAFGAGRVEDVATAYVGVGVA